MKQQLLIIALMLTAPFARGQDATGRSKASRLHVGVQASPDIAYRSLLLVHRNPASENIIAARNHHDMQRLGFTGNFFVGYSFSERIALEIGAGYALRGWEIDISKLTFGDAIDPRRGFIYNTNDVLGPVREDFHFIHVPVRATCTLGQGRLRFIGSIGAAADFLLRAQHVGFWNGERRAQDMDGFRALDLTAIASVGAAIRVWERNIIRVEPTFRHGLLNLRENDPIGVRLWGYGIALGFARAL
jgi:hypothetical protein